MTLRKRMIAVGALVAASAITLSGCSGSGSTGGSTPGPVNTDSLKGQTVNISGAFTGDQATAFQADVSKWAQPLGLTVKYNGSNSFQEAIVTQVKGGQAPDVAIFPAPGVLKGLISQGAVPLDSLIDVKSTIADEPAGLTGVATAGGKTYGLPYSVNTKSIVWYNPAAFKKANYTVPTTDQELTALSAKIVSDGTGYPWCVGDKDGWPMTDWLEQYVLDYGGTSQYQQWIDHTVKFSSPLVTKAATKVADMLFQQGQVNGGQAGIIATPFGTAGNALFSSGKAKGQCFMMRQGSFMAGPGFFPDTYQKQAASGDTTNLNTFPLPAAEGGQAGTIAGGDYVGAFKNNDAVKAVVGYLTGKDFGTNGYAKSWTPHISAHSDYTYSNGLQSAFAKSITGAKAIAFDASDQMPGAVGSGTEWTQLTAWAGGKQDLATTLKNIDASWPSS